MPEVSGDFCREGYGWVAGIVREGAPLHFLCSECWYGTCTCTEHTFFCERFFHRRRFRIPVEFHYGALCVFFARVGADTEVGEQLSEYCRCLLRSYDVKEVFELARRHVRMRPWLTDAVCAVSSEKGWSRATLGLTSRCVVNAAETCIVPRSLLPVDMCDVTDHADGLLTTQLAANYLDWLHRGGLVHPVDFPSLRHAIGRVLSRLPLELRGLVTRHLFLEYSIACGGHSYNI